MNKAIASLILGIFSIAPHVSASDEVKPYDRIGISYEYNIQSPKTNVDFTSSGFGVEYIHGFCLSEQTPIFLETGAKLYCYIKSFDEDDFYYGYDEYDADTYMYSLRVPINFSYRFSFPNSEITIAPFVGMNLKYHINGQLKIETPYSKKESKFDLFDKDDMGVSGVYNHCQLGSQIGVGINIKRVYIGVCYDRDLTKIDKAGTSSYNLTTSVGLYF